VSNNLVDRAIQAAAEEFAGIIYQRLEQCKAALARPIESPIEEALLAAFVGFASAIPVVSMPGLKFPVMSTRVSMELDTQVPVEGFRADFEIICRYGGEEYARLLIECDGHDYHERTKEQAARDKSRDRKLTAAGYRVIRFTGSEIYRNAYSCVADVFDVAYGLIPTTLKGERQ